MPKVFIRLMKIQNLMAQQLLQLLFTRIMKSVTVQQTSHFKQGIRCKQSAARTQIHWKKDCNEDHPEAQVEKRQPPRPQPPKQVVLLGTPDMAAGKRQWCLYPCVLGNQAAEPILQTCPSYNMLRKTHWPVETSHADMCWPQHAEEDSLTRGDLPGHNMSRKSQWPVETSPADMSWPQHVEEESVTCGDLPTDMSWPRVEEDSLASGDGPPCRQSSAAFSRN